MLLAIAAILLLLLLAFKLLDIPAVVARHSSELLEVTAAEVPIGQAHLLIEVEHLKGASTEALAILGFGLSDPTRTWNGPNPKPPLGRAEEASQQLEAAIRFIFPYHVLKRLSVIAHPS